MSAQPPDGDSSNPPLEGGSGDLGNPPLEGGSGGEAARGGDLGNPREAPQGRDSSNPPLAGGSGGEAARGGEATEEETWPIGFMIILTLVVLYLGWRLVQGIGWIIDKL